MKVYRYNFYRGFYGSPRYSMECSSIVLFDVNVSSRFGGLIRRENDNGYIPLIEVNKVGTTGVYLSFRKLSESEIKKLGNYGVNEDICLQNGLWMGA